MTVAALGLLKGKQRKPFTRNGQQIKRATVLFSGQVVLERMVMGIYALVVSYHALECIPKQFN